MSRHREDDMPTAPRKHKRAAVDPRDLAAALVAIADQRSLRPGEAADYLTHVRGCPTSHGHLANMRVTGGGPPFRPAGRYITYTRDALAGYADAPRGPARGSTSTRAA